MQNKAKKVNKKTKNIWTWLQSKATILKIVSNPKRGTIKIYNKKGKIIIKKTNLTREQVKTVEESLLGYATKKLIDTNAKQNEKSDPMIT
jgi:hypothetical protein